MPSETGQLTVAELLKRIPALKRQNVLRAIRAGRIKATQPLGPNTLYYIPEDEVQRLEREQHVTPAAGAKAV